MPDQAKTNEIIEALAQHEEAISRLYTAYAKKFPSCNDFWHSLAMEETSHAAWIRTLHQKTDAGLVEFAESRFPLSGIEMSKQFVDGKTAAAGDIGPLAEALAVAVDVERGMIEKKFFEVFEGDSLELKVILDALRVSTENHLGEITKAWEREKKS